MACTLVGSARQDRHGDRIDVAPDGISVTLHAAGIRSLVAELAVQETPALAASEPLLEAAE